jgi:hypothetical protein
MKREISLRRELANTIPANTRLTAASDKIYQLLAHNWWFSPGTPAFSTTKPGRHDIVEILLKVALNTVQSIHQSKANDIGHTLFHCNICTSISIIV